MQSPIILGSSGFLGLNLVDALTARGVTPRCVRRARSNVLALRKRRVPLVTADLDDPASLREAIEGSDVVFHCAGHYPRYSLDPGAAIEVGLRQTRAVLDACAEAGVRRLVYVSSVATVAPAAGPSTEADAYPHPPGHGTYHDVKWAMERQVLDETRFTVTVALPGAFLGPWDLRVGTSALLVALARDLAPAHPDGWVNLVDVRDVARALLILAEVDDPPARLILSGGDHRLHALLERLAPRYGATSTGRLLPAAAARALADAEEARCAEAGRGRPVLFREIVDLVVHGVRVDTSRARALGCTWTPLDQTLTDWEAWARRLRILPTTPATEPT